jgi:hypothetical protein
MPVYEGLLKLISNDDLTLAAGPVEQPMLYSYGWICPRCGRVWAPGVQTCGCPPPTRTGTTIEWAYKPPFGTCGEILG